MSIYIGNQEINPSGLSAVYVGNNKVWPTEYPPTPTCLVTFRNIKTDESTRITTAQTYGGIESSVILQGGETQEKTYNNPFYFMTGQYVEHFKLNGQNVSIGSTYTVDGCTFRFGSYYAGGTRNYVECTCYNPITVRFTKPSLSN